MVTWVEVPVVKPVSHLLNTGSVLCMNRFSVSPNVETEGLGGGGGVRSFRESEGNPVGVEGRVGDT